MALSELKKRVIGAIYFGLPFLIFLYFGGIYLKIFFILLSLISLYELLKISNSKDLFFLLPLVIFPYFIDKILSILLFMIILYLIFLFKKYEPKDLTNFFLINYLFLLITTLPLIFFFLIRVEKGLSYSLLVIFSIWISDISAYFVGKRFGKNKILPKISPNKSYQGLFGSLIFTSIFILVVNIFFKFFNNIFLLLLFSFSLVILSFLGDTFESLIKRYFNVKDSGNIILGHGGLFDRIDSFIFTIPIIYFML